MTLIHWNGHDLPPELRALPAGTYAIQDAEEALTLSPDEERGLVEALSSLEAGRGVEHDALRARILRHIRT